MMKDGRLQLHEGARKKILAFRSSTLAVPMLSFNSKQKNIAATAWEGHGNQGHSWVKAGVIPLSSCLDQQRHSPKIRKIQSQWCGRGDNKNPLEPQNQLQQLRLQTFPLNIPLNFLQEIKPIRVLQKLSPQLGKLTISMGPSSGGGKRQQTPQCFTQILSLRS